MPPNPPPDHHPTERAGATPALTNPRTNPRTNPPANPPANPRANPPTNPPANPPTNLAARLREGTAAAHRAAERMALIRGLLRGLTEPTAYAALLRGLLAPYSAMEAALERHRADPLIAPFVLPQLWRRGALLADLAAIDPAHADDEALIERSPASAAYAARIEQLAARAPVMLVAHAYVRYLGDLAGGRILGKMIGRALHLTPSAGLAFFEFPEIPDPAAFCADYRRRLDQLPIDPPTAARLIDEANHAFRLNMALFAEIEGSALRGALRLALGRRPQPPPLQAGP